MNTKNKTSSKVFKPKSKTKKKRKGWEKFPSKVIKMTNVVRNGLKQELTFKGALHLSLRDKKVAGVDKLVINVNKTENGVWADFIVIYSFLDNSYENFRIGGKIDKSLTGHQDLMKWLEMSMDELDWNGIISSCNKDALVVELFNFINGVSDAILTSDTEFEIKDQDGLGVETFYPWPEDTEDDPEDEEEEVEEEVVEEIIEETTEEIIDFENYEFIGTHERGGNKRSDKYIDKRVGSVIYAVSETDEDGNDHFIGGDILKASKSIYGGPSRVVSIYNLDDVERVRNEADDVVERVIKASDLNLQAEIEIAEVVLKIDIEKLLDKIQEGLEWKASSQSTNEPVSEYYY